MPIPLKKIVATNENFRPQIPEPLYSKSPEQQECIENLIKLMKRACNTIQLTDSLLKISVVSWSNQSILNIGAYVVFLRCQQQAFYSIQLITTVTRF